MDKIASRPDPDYSAAGLKEDNRQCCEGFLKAGEQVSMIDKRFEQAIESLLNG